MKGTMSERGTGALPWRARCPEPLPGTPANVAEATPAEPSGLHQAAAQTATTARRFGRGFPGLTVEAAAAPTVPLVRRRTPPNVPPLRAIRRGPRAAHQVQLTTW